MIAERLSAKRSIHKISNASTFSKKISLCKPQLNGSEIKITNKEYHKWVRSLTGFAKTISWFKKKNKRVNETYR